MGINPNNKITIIIRMLFAVTLFQQNSVVGHLTLAEKSSRLKLGWGLKF
jgi:hypothetical protein